MTFFRSMRALVCSVLIAGCASTPSVSPPAELPVPVAAKPALLEVQPSDAQVMAAVDEERNVFFQSGAAQMDGAGLQTVQRHAERLRANPKLVVTLLGYTDDLGSPSYNLAIAEQRINAVAKQLRAQGVPLKQIRRQVAGRETQAQACRSAECRARMRRVEFSYAE